MSHDPQLCPVAVKGANGKETRGEIRIQIWSPRERMVRAAKAWGISWGIALVTVLIPLAHFVLVPSFLIAGPIVGFVMYNQKSTVLGGQTTCPECGQQMPIVRTKEKWPLKDVCAKCYQNVTIEKV